MSRARTKDEQFILKMYELTQKANDPDLELDRYKVGTAIGLQARGVNAITVLLAQAMFIKKVDDTLYTLTQRGVDLALLLLSD